MDKKTDWAFWLLWACVAAIAIVAGDFAMEIWNTIQDIRFGR